MSAGKFPGTADSFRGRIRRPWIASISITTLLRRCCRRLAEAGFTVDWLPVDRTGVVRVEALAELVRPDTQMVSVMLANHETGGMQPVSALAAQVASGSGKPRRALFHCDGAAAAGKVP